MNKNILNNIKVTQVVDFIKDKSNSLLISGLWSSAKSFLITSVSERIDRTVNLVLLTNKEDASGCAGDLYLLAENENDVYFFPPSNNEKRGGFNNNSYKIQRMAAIRAVNQFKKGLIENHIYIVCYPESLTESVVSDSAINSSYIGIAKGDNVGFETIREKLFSFKFEKRDFVSQPGEFAIRGGIIDVFSYSNNNPYRVEFFGDEIENIREFDINTQRSIKQIESIEITPDLLNRESDKKESLFSFLPQETLLWITGIDGIYNKDTIQRESFIKEIEGRKKIFFSNIDKSLNYDKEVRFNTIPQPVFNKNFDLLASDIREKTESGYSVRIMSDNPKQIDRLKSIFDTFKLKVTFENHSIYEGFIENDEKISLYTDHQIFERLRRIDLKRSVEKSERLTINDLNSFQIGDYVVHIDHGTGQFGGLVKTTVNGKTQEAVKLIYRDNDILFVSIHGLHRISRYKSKDSQPPKVYKLGTGAWQKLKTQTKRKVKDIAEDLIKLYAERRVVKGFAFSPDTYMQKELESSFMYEDTPDQYKANVAIKEDMERDFPMDRLVCGDVGFGKTELAIRAAFKAVADNKQVAVLVPTTILALQHYRTFSNRLKDMPCNIDYISRLRKTKDISDIKQRLKSGTLDIVIGTHRLLNKEIDFKDIGLLIIDEEQKFGVAAKERLRQMRISVDTLTMTATPIPRTLQFSLLGARDLSIINTPPPNRLPVETEIIDFNEDYLYDIISYELERGGQIFFVHNRVEDILSIEEMIRRIVPGIKTIVAHGQMEAGQLESRVLDFIEGDYDILIATTIIENGIDIPNANTIIINSAQNFGLSDLHQLRGRVGRSNRKAFCYLIVPPVITLSEEARRRLKAIETFSDLGSGFNIAMQDLDIRGMGNLLGGEQSGFIAEMGFETYHKILSEVFAEMKDKQGKGDGEDIDDRVDYLTDCTIDTDLDLRIPDEYINITSEKIRLYKELDAISDDEKLTIFTEELKDRYGPIPEELRQLTFITTLRREAIKRAIERIILKNGKMIAYFISNQLSPFYRSGRFVEIIKSIQTMHHKINIKEQNNKLYFIVDNVDSVELACNIIKMIG